MEILPSWLTTRPVGAGATSDPFYNPLLRNGEVVGVVYPEDPRSVTKRFLEYDVEVAHHENGTSSTRVYHACILANDLAGLADRSFRVLRAGDAGTTSIGDGSKVLVQCLNGEAVQAVIVGGIRDERDTDLGRKVKGLHLEWEYNGVRVEIKDDGSFSVLRRGATTATGGLDTGRGAEGGARVDVDKDGGVSVTTSDGKESVRLDRPGGEVKIAADKKIRQDAGKIEIGGSSEHLILGDTYRRAEQQKNTVDIPAALATLVAACAVPGSPFAPLGPGFSQLLVAYQTFEANGPTFLSRDVTTK